MTCRNPSAEFAEIEIDWKLTEARAMPLFDEIPHQLQSRDRRAFTESFCCDINHDILKPHLVAKCQDVVLVLQADLHPYKHPQNHKTLVPHCI
jgi:hypothetical protein